MSAEMAVWLRNCLYLNSYLSHNSLLCTWDFCRVFQALLAIIANIQRTLAAPCRALSANAWRCRWPHTTAYVISGPSFLRKFRIFCRFFGHFRGLDIRIQCFDTGASASRRALMRFGVVICVERGADCLHMVNPDVTASPNPTVSCLF